MESGERWRAPGAREGGGSGKRGVRSRAEVGGTTSLMTVVEGDGEMAGAERGERVEDGGELELGAGGGELLLLVDAMRIGGDGEGGSFVGCGSRCRVIGWCGRRRRSSRMR